MNKEIEKKYSVIDIPNFNDISKIKVCKIIQQYMYNDIFTAVRKRSIQDLDTGEFQYTYTIKTIGDLKNKNSSYEIETYITKEKYDSIKSNRTLEKVRIKFQIENNLQAELDLYYGNLTGLITVEVEFESEEQMNNFKKPNWFGEELDKKYFSNANLAIMTRNQFINLLGKDKINSNMINVNKIKNYLSTKNYGG